MEKTVDLSKITLTVLMILLKSEIHLAKIKMQLKDYLDLEILGENPNGKVRGQEIVKKSKNINHP